LGLIIVGSLRLLPEGAPLLEYPLIEQ